MFDIHNLPSNNVLAYKIQTQFTEGEIDNLNTTVKDEENRLSFVNKQLVQMQNQTSQGFLSKGTQNDIQLNQSNLENQNDTPFYNEAQQNDQNQQNHSVKEEKRNTFIQDLIFKSQQTQDDLQKIPTKLSIVETKLKKDLKSKTVIGYEKYRKGFEATNRGKIELAQIHRKAKKVKKIDIQDIENNDLCSCCGLPVEGKLFSLNCNVEEFADFGVGFSLYFIYLKFAIILLLIA